MNFLPRAVSKVVESFQKLPGIGPKTAQRLAFYLLHVPQTELDHFGENLINLRKSTLLCGICKNVAEVDPCSICTDSARDPGTICVVEAPLDVLSLERIGKFRGVYHVLHGALDPLNNIGPEEIYINELIQRIKNLRVKPKEIILATNPNMEGEATALYITKQLKVTNDKLQITRLARGLPMGADIEYADEVTLARALEGRREW